MYELFYCWLVYIRLRTGSSSVKRIVNLEFTANMSLSNAYLVRVISAIHFEYWHLYLSNFLVFSVTNPWVKRWVDNMPFYIANSKCHYFFHKLGQTSKLVYYADGTVWIQHSMYLASSNPWVILYWMIHVVFVLLDVTLTYTTYLKQQTYQYKYE